MGYARVVMNVRLVLFVRFPDPGQCKTRLIPALGPQGAADIHRILAQRTHTTLRASGHALTIAYTGASAAQFARWLGPDADLVEQEEGDLSSRLLPFAQQAPVIFFGADTPDLRAHHVDAAVRALDTHEVVIGPAEDGGYYLIGMRRALPQLLVDMPWSTDQVLPQTLGRLGRMGIAPAMLDMLADCDRPGDLARWPDLAR